MSRAKTAPPDSGAAHTRERLVVTAVRLFAEQGLHGVSLRAVALAAGAKNTAAVHYHFGDRETLLQAAVEHVVAASNEPVTPADALALGLALPAPPTPLHGLLAEAFLPTLTLPERYPWGGDGIRLLARILTGDAGAIAGHLEAVSLADDAALLAALRPLLPPVDDSVLRARIDFAIVSVVCGMASMAYAGAARGPVQAQGAAALAAALLDYIAGGLSAPAHR